MVYYENKKGRKALIMNENILKKFNLEELKKLRDMIANNENLLSEEIESREHQVRFYDPYLVSEKRKRIAEISDIKRMQCWHILKKIKIEDLHFLYRNFYCSTGNNKKGNLNYTKLLLEYPEVQEIAKSCGIINMERGLTKEFCNHPYIVDLKQRVYFLSYVDRFFKGTEQILDYEGSCNTFLYVKEYICDCIDEEKDMEENFQTVFLDVGEKIEYVKANFKEIANFLLEERNRIPFARLSIYNNAISRGARKFGQQFTMDQKEFIDAIAFGNTLEDLQQGNYENMKRLIYIPTEKYKKIKL